MEQKIFETHEHLFDQLPVLLNRQRYCSYGRKVFTSGNWHKNIELLYFLDGEGFLYCNGSEYVIRPGCLIVINSNELHGLLSSNGMEYLCLIVDTAFLSDCGILVDTVSFTTLVCDSIANKLFLKVAEEYFSRDRYSGAAIRASILDLLVYLARQHSLPERKHQSTDDTIKHAIAYIHTNASEMISLEHVANEVNLDKCYLSREFKKATGMTVVFYLNMVRCENAKRILQQKNCSVSEAARLCGFESCSYFAKIFKRIIGCLPSEIIRENEVSK